MHRLATLSTVLLLLFATQPAHGQLDQTFQNLFDQILIEDFQLSPGPHRNHFIPAAELANGVLTPALNRMIASNVASFPLSSTVAGVTFDFSSGQPVATSEGLGPIFAETASTLGQGNFLVGFNATHLSLDRFRGMPVDDVSFSFTHEDTGEPGLGDDPNELDVVHVSPRMNVDATIMALFATVGIFRNLDIGVAVPIVRVALSGDAVAEIDSRTFFIQSPFGGGATHFFGGNAQAPVLTETVSYDESAVGVGDISLRLKYQLPIEVRWKTALLLDVRVPTGSEADFMGTGDLSTRLIAAVSSTSGAFSPHANVGYDFRGSDFDSDEAEFVVGFAQQVTEKITFALDLMGEFDLSSDEAIRLYDDDFGNETRIIDFSPDTNALGERIVNLSNVPTRDLDHTINLSVGLRAAPSDRSQLLFNVIVPLQDGGLRSTVAPTVGGVMTF